jgi:hypothetical protein
MTEPKFTDGPWWFEHHRPDTEGDLPFSYLCHEGGSLYEGGFTSADDRENSANAALIAAAPDLYHALDDILRVIATDRLIPESVSYMQQARAALAHALNKTPRR